MLYWLLLRSAFGGKGKKKKIQILLCCYAPPSVIFVITP